MRYLARLIWSLEKPASLPASKMSTVGLVVREESPQPVVALDACVGLLSVVDKMGLRSQACSMVITTGVSDHATFGPLPESSIT